MHTNIYHLHTDIYTHHHLAWFSVSILPNANFSYTSRFSVSILPNANFSYTSRFSVSILPNANFSYTTHSCFVFIDFTLGCTSPVPSLIYSMYRILLNSCYRWSSKPVPTYLYFERNIWDRSFL